MKFFLSAVEYVVEKVLGRLSTTREQPTSLTTVKIGQRIPEDEVRRRTAVGLASVNEDPDAGVDELGEESASIVHPVPLQ